MNLASAEDIQRLRQISEILVGSDNHHGIFLSQLAAKLEGEHHRVEPGDRCEVPSNCLVIQCRDGYRVEFEAEANTHEKGYEVWLTLFSGDEQCASGSTVVPSLDQFTLRGLALGWAEGWDRG